MLVCGLDIGSTNVKAVLADERGRSVWVKSVPTPRKHDGINIATDAAALVAHLEDLIIEGWQAVAKGEPIAAIAGAGVGEDGICADENLNPLGLVIPWFDKRAMAEVRDFGSRFAHTRADFHTTAGKWLWLRSNRSSEINAAKLWITLTDYASTLWCSAPFMSETLAARTGCYDILNRRWDDAALAYAKAPPLPRLLKAGDIAGTMRPNRLTASGAATTQTLIVAAGHDHPIASSAIQRLDPSARVDSLGTANAIYGETRNTAADLSATELEASVPALGGPGLSLIGVTEFSATLLASFGGAEQIRTHLAKPAFDAADAEALRLKASLEQMARRARMHLDHLAAAGVPQGPLFATGGWSRSNLLMQLRADIFQETIHVVDEPELTGLGAALAALAAATGSPPQFELARSIHRVMPSGRQE